MYGLLYPWTTVGYHNILLITDLFSRLAVVVQIMNLTAEGIYNRFITIYWTPVRIHSEQGAKYNGNVIKDSVASRGWGNRKPEHLPTYTIQWGIGCEEGSTTHFLTCLELLFTHSWSQAGKRTFLQCLRLSIVLNIRLQDSLPIYWCLREIHYYRLM